MRIKEIRGYGYLRRLCLASALTAGLAMTTGVSAGVAQVPVDPDAIAGNSQAVSQLSPFNTTVAYVAQFSDNASAIVNPWMRVIGITDPRKTFHSHRHTVKTLLRGKLVPEDVNDAITGHSNAKVGRQYGAYPIPDLAAAIELLPE